MQNGIILKTTGNLFYYNKKGDYFKSSEVRNWLGGDIPNNASSRISNLATINWVWENTLNYSKTIHDNHNFDILLGATAEKLTSESHTLSGDKFPNDIVRTVQNGEFDNVRSSKIEQTLISYLGRINYSYKDKYLASFTMRRDGSSRFGPNRKWGNFPSASLGWRISDEEFMSNIPLLNDLKLRTSYGLTGNKEIGDYRFISPLVRSDYTLNGQVRAGQNIAGFENPDLSWERSNQFDIGFDLLFHDNRYSLSVDYYIKTTKDMLLTIPVASASGYGSAITNIGLMENKGMEFSLNANNNVGEISIDTNLNLSFNRNTVLETNAFNDPIFDGFNITTVGYPISSFHGSVADGIIQNQAEFDAAPRASNASWEGIGGPNYLDIDGDGRHNFGDDFTIIGNPEPDFVYGFSSRFDYKNFDLSFVFNGQKGGQLLAATKQWYFLFEGPLVNQAAEVLDRWRSEENPGGGSIPIASSASVRYRFVNSDWVENNSYLWLRNVNLGWTLPKNFIEKAGLKNAKVNFTALNTLLLSKNKWSMPEASRGGNSATQQGADENSYPIPMSFSLGLNISL